jgi:hypothetical protein
MCEEEQNRFGTSAHGPPFFRGMAIRTTHARKSSGGREAIHGRYFTGIRAATILYLVTKGLDAVSTGSKREAARNP